jgi:hypothetical protein
MKKETPKFNPLCPRGEGENNAISKYSVFYLLMDVPDILL